MAGKQGGEKGRPMIDRTKHRKHVPHETKIDIDPELRAFILAILPFGTFAEIAEECLSVFGPERAPARSALSDA